MGELNPQQLILTLSQREELIELAKKQMPREACGMIGGKNNKASQIFAVKNISQNNTTYLMNPEEQVSTFFKIEKLGLALVAIFHSHPYSPPLPSPTDIARSTYPDIPNIIIGKDKGEWVLKGFLINNQGYTPIDLEFSPD